MRTLEGKRVLITGGAGGIGAASARLFAGEGATVAITDIIDDAGVRLARDLGPDHQYFHHDVTDETSWKEVLSQINRLWGALDILFLNAGVMSRPNGAPMFDDVFQWMTPACLEKNIGVNIRGVVLGAVAALPLLRSGEDATILVTSSVAGIAVNAQDPFYTLSKHAVTGFARALAPHLPAMGINIATICPVGVDTAMTPPDLREMKSREGKHAPTAEQMAASALHIYKHAKNGDVWVGGLLDETYRYDYAPLN